MNVYDEYVRNQPPTVADDGSAAQTNGGTENMAPSQEEAKDGEA